MSFHEVIHFPYLICLLWWLEGVKELDVPFMVCPLSGSLCSLYSPFFGCFSFLIIIYINSVSLSISLWWGFGGWGRKRPVKQRATGVSLWQGLGTGELGTGTGTGWARARLGTDWAQARARSRAGWARARHRLGTGGLCPNVTGTH